MHYICQERGKEGSYTVAPIIREMDPAASRDRTLSRYLGICEATAIRRLPRYSAGLISRLWNPEQVILAKHSNKLSDK